MRTPDKSCGKKVRYDSKRAARKARRAVTGGAPLSIYRCTYCDYYHLGHIPQVIRSGELPREEWI